MTDSPQEFSGTYCFSLGSTSLIANMVFLMFSTKSLSFSGTNSLKPYPSPSFKQTVPKHSYWGTYDWWLNMSHDPTVDARSIHATCDSCHSDSVLDVTALLALPHLRAPFKLKFYKHPTSYLILPSHYPRIDPYPRTQQYWGNLSIGT